MSELIAQKYSLIQHREIKLEDAQVETLLGLKKEAEVAAWNAQNEYHKIFKPFFSKRDGEVKSVPQCELYCSS